MAIKKHERFDFAFEANQSHLRAIQREAKDNRKRTHLGITLVVENISEPFAEHLARSYYARRRRI